MVATVRRPESADLMAENWRAHRLLTAGVPVDRRRPSGELRHDVARLLDLEDVGANDFVVVNQLTVVQDGHQRRADVVAYVNGIPLAVLELKAPGQEGATLGGAFRQLQTYAREIPALMSFTAVSVISTGTQSRVGALGGRREHYAAWRTVDGAEPDRGRLELDVLVEGVFTPHRFLDLVTSFIAFTDERSGLVKRIAKPHQVHAVNLAVGATLEAVSRGDGRAGVVWHTQGSGKSLEMLFYVGKIMREPRMANPTAVLLTDRNDLDDQLFDEVFAPTRSLPETPVQATSRENLRDLLAARASGGIIFSTMQKFGLGQADRDAGRRFPVLTDRGNVVVIADEAHRTQYDLIDGLAANLRDALPRAAFIGFTGTPIESGDRSTGAVFGEYIHVYDLTDAVRDEATVRVYYEARLAKVELPEEVRETLDDQFAAATERSEDESRERLKGRWARVEAVVGARARIQQVAADLVEHWEARRDQQVGKGLVVCMSRRICAELYDEIVALRPEWHGDDDGTGRIKVVITGSAADGPEMARHVRPQQAMRALKERAKDPDDPLELVIVRDMWLTGFDSPSMHTMYVDKPMKGAGLMQAIRWSRTR